MHKSLRLGKLLVIPYDSFSNYVNLPSNILERISKMKNQHMPYHFELKTSYNLCVYVGVKEFTAPDDCIEVPTWLASQLAEDYLMLTFLKDIPKGEYIKIQPQSESFFKIPESDKILEAALSNYCLLKLNQIIEVQLLDDIHKIKIIECKMKVSDTENTEVIEITNVDMKVDIDNIFYKEEPKVIVPDIIPDNCELPMIPCEIPVIPSGIKLGGETVNIDNVKEARLKYYNKLTKFT